MPGKRNLRDSATENKPPNQGKGETARVRAHRFLSNKKRMENPAWSKTK